MSIDSDDDLDLSWLDKHEKMANVDHNYFKEPMNRIKIHFVYINVNDYIDKIVSEYQELQECSENYSKISNDRLLRIIQSHKTRGDIKYQLLDILLFNVDIDPENINILVNRTDLIEEDSNFIKTLSPTQDIILPHSIFVFHDINAIYLLFQEVINIEKTYKPILKILDGSETPPQRSMKKTKKVTINTPRLPRTKKRQV